MKYILLSFFLYGCTPKDAVHETMHRSVFPSYIEMGPDFTVPRTDSFIFPNYRAYIATCGVNPEFEAPLMGVKVYPILSPASVTIGWCNYNGQTVPYCKGSKPGVYKFVGSLYILGFRPCDSTYQNVNLYDTITVTVARQKKLR